MKRTALAFLAAFAAPAAAQRELKDVPQPDIARELSQFKLAEGLEINLFASDPAIAKPIQMNWDPEGRLWVASSYTYPQIKPGEPARDEVVMLEDTKGTGRADKRTVFADGLLIPTGVLPGDGGCYVANSTEILHLSDPGPDGKARKRRVVLSGFGTEDTHHIIHAFRWGPDGRMYFNQSIYIHSHVETPFGPRQLLAGGVWQFHPPSGRLEVFARGFVNTWGHVFDEWGQSFATDGANGEGVSHIFPEAVYPTADGFGRTLHGMSAGQPKHCGLEIVSGRGFPADWQGNFVANDFRGNRVNRFALTRAGSGYAARQLPDVVASTNVAFRPIDVKMGPDGALYIADWYNPIIQHGEVDFRDPRRDHAHGRIWRITHKSHPPLPRRPLRNAGTPELIGAALNSPELHHREQARRVLHERGAGIVPDVLAAAPLAAQSDQSTLETNWLLHAVGAFSIERLGITINAADPRARAAGIRLLSQNEPGAKLARLARFAVDPDPLVRLEAVTALRAIGTPVAVEAALAAVDLPVDAELDFALWRAARDNQAAWLPEYLAGTLKFGGKVNRQLFALKAAENPAALRPLIDAWRVFAVKKPDLPAVLDLCVTMAGPRELRELYRAMVAHPDAEQRLMVLQALERAARQRGAKPAGKMAAFMPWLLRGSIPQRACAARLAGLWKHAEAHDTLLSWLADAQQPEELRRAALAGLAAWNEPAERTRLAEFAGSGEPSALRIAAAAELARVDPQAAAPVARKLLSEPLADAAAAVLTEAFLRAADGPAALAGALSGQSIHSASAAAALRAANGSGLKVEALAAALRSAGKLAPLAAVPTGAELAALVAEVRERGDPARGEAVYRRKELNCQTCHAIGPAGGLVGPNLLSIGASAPIDYLVESLLEPSKKIKEGYHTMLVRTEDGATLTGIQVSRTDRELRLRDKDGKEFAIPAERIAAAKPSPVSLMPQDIVGKLPRNDLVDLVRFMSELGKEGPYKISAAPLVRQWRTLANARDPSRHITRIGQMELLRVGTDWEPVLSTVSGGLPLAELPIHGSFGGVRLSFVRATVAVAEPGVVKLRLDDPAGLLAYRGDVQLPAGREIALDLPKGAHELTFVVDRNVRTAPLRVELVETAGAVKPKP